MSAQPALAPSARMAASALQWQFVDDTASMWALRDEWTALWQAVPDAHLLHGFTWCWHVWSEVASTRGRALRLLTGRLDGALVLLWPMMLDGRLLRMLSSDTIEYRDLLVRPDACADAWIEDAWQQVRRHSGADIFWFQELRTPSRLGATLARQPGVRQVAAGWCPLITLHRYPDWDAYARRLPKRLLDDQRRQWRRAREALPGLAFSVVSQAADVEPLTRWILEHKFRWLAAKGRRAPHFTTPESVRMFLRSTQAHGAAGQLVLARLGDGEQIVSAGFGYRFGDRFLFHMFVYDEAWNRLSPSRLFLESLVRWCLGQGLREFDFMPGTEPYKYVWADELLPVDTYSGALNARGALALAWRDRLRHASDGWVRLGVAAYRRMPNAWRARLYAMLQRLGIIGADLAEAAERPRLGLSSD